MISETALLQSWSDRGTGFDRAGVAIPESREAEVNGKAIAPTKRLIFMDILLSKVCR
jgi:hypothetical protein